MRTGSNLKRRGATYYARQIVPVELQHLMGKRELIRSLNASDARTATSRKLAVLSEWQHQFDDLRRRRDITEADFASATWEHYVAELRLDEVDRAMPGADRSSVGDIRQYHIRALRDHLGRGEMVLIHWAADAYIDRNKLLVARGSEQYRKLCFRLMRAQIEAPYARWRA